MESEFRLRVSTKDGRILALLSIGVFIVLFIGSLFEHKYSVPMRYVSFGMSLLLFIFSLGLYQIGNFTIVITKDHFVFGSLLKRRVIPLNSIESLSLKPKRSVSDLIVVISIRNALDFKFNRYNVTDEDIDQMIRFITRMQTKK